jgi:hypothetical protein
MTSIKDLRLAKTASDEVDQMVKQNEEESGFHPPQTRYKEAPSDYSFFFPEDLNALKQQ